MATSQPFNVPTVCWDRARFHTRVYELVPQSQNINLRSWWKRDGAVPAHEPLSTFFTALDIVVSDLAWCQIHDVQGSCFCTRKAWDGYLTNIDLSCAGTRLNTPLHSQRCLRVHRGGFGIQGVQHLKPSRDPESSVQVQAPVFWGEQPEKTNSFPIQSKTSLKILGGKASVTFEWRVRCVKGKSRVTRLAGTKPACVSQQFHLAVNWILGTGHDGKILLKLEETTEIFKMFNPTSSTPNSCGFAKRVHFEYRPRPYPPKPPLEILHPRLYTSTPNSNTSVVMRG